jgi:hypothetical protein
MPSGYLYVLVNPSIPGLAKVGKTTRDPADRVAELSSATGVASPFILLYQQPVADCDKAEEWVHDALTSRGWRYAPNREFFSAPSHEIVSLVFQAAQVVAGPEQPQNGGKSAVPDDAGTSAQISEGERLATLALELIAGGPNTLADRPRGILLLQQAADLGFLPACSAIGRWLLRGELGAKKDLQKAYRYLCLSLEGGDLCSHALLAELFMENFQREAAQKQWSEYFYKTATLLLTLPKDGPDYQRIASHAGEFGLNYCRFLRLERINDIIDDACFFVLAPHIEQSYKAGREALPAYPPTLRIRMDIETDPLRAKSKRGALLPAWAP